MTAILRLWYALWLFVAFFRDLVVSSLAVARTVLSRKDAAEPRFVTVPLRHARSDLELGFSAAGQDHRITGFVQSESDAASDTATGARDYSDLVQTSFVRTLPATSVKRKSRPWNL